MKSKERRRALRLEVTGNVTTRLTGIDCTVELKDIGLGGCQIHSAVPIAPGAVHQLEFSTPDGWSTTLTARSVHTRRKASNGPALYAIGFAFVGESAESVVTQLIDRITSALSFD